MSATVKITLAEPSLIIRSGIVSVLRAVRGMHFELHEVEELDTLRNALTWQKPDILLVNPVFLGMMPLSQLKKDTGNPQMRCVALHFSLPDCPSLKNFDEVISLFDSTEQIQDMLRKLLDAGEDTDTRRESLSTREIEVVVCVVKGMTNKQIAEKLHLSTHTVITHRRNISAKLQIHSTAGLTIYAIVNKLVELDQVKDSASENE